MSSLGEMPVAEVLVAVPQPTQPWKLTRAKTIRRGARPIVLAAVAALVVLFTGFAGPDGWFIVFAGLIFVDGYVVHRKQGRLKQIDSLTKILVTVGATLAFVPWMSIFWSLVTKGFNGIYFGFFFNDMRLTTPDDELNLGGAGHAIVGSLIMVLIATMITLPLGILSGVYITEVRGKFAGLVRFVLLSMSGVPSIVAGLFIYATFIAWTHSFSGIAGALALAILMLPTVARTAEEVLKLVPDDLRSASYALGSSQWRSSLMVVLPTVRSGLITAGILGVARVVGETAPLLLTSLSNTAIKLNPMSGPIGSMPTYVFGLLQIGTEYAIARAWAGALVMMLIVLMFFSLARILGGQDRR